MLWSELVRVMAADVLVSSDDFEIRSIAAADSLSDILATEKEELVVLTGQIAPPAIRTAMAVGALGVMIVRGRNIPPETIELARHNNIPLAVTQLKMFEACVTAGALMWNSPSSRS